MRFFRFLVMLCLFINGISAIVAGALFIIKPDGSLIGLNKQLLKHSPFNNFLIPGITLFIFNGLLSLYALRHLWKQTSRSHIYLFVQGIILLGWLIVEILLIREINFLHTLMGSIAILLIVSAVILRPAQTQFP